MKGEVEGLQKEEFRHEIVFLFDHLKNKMKISQLKYHRSISMLLKDLSDIYYWLIKKNINLFELYLKDNLQKKINIHQEEVRLPKNHKKVFGRIIRSCEKKVKIVKRVKSEEKIDWKCWELNKLHSYNFQNTMTEGFQSFCQICETSKMKFFIENYKEINLEKVSLNLILKVRELFLDFPEKNLKNLSTATWERICCFDYKSSIKSYKQLQYYKKQLNELKAFIKEEFKTKPEKLKQPKYIESFKKTIYQMKAFAKKQRMNEFLLRDLENFLQEKFFEEFEIILDLQSKN